MTKSRFKISSKISGGQKMKKVFKNILMLFALVSLSSCESYEDKLPHLNEDAVLMNEYSFKVTSFSYVEKITIYDENMQKETFDNEKGTYLLTNLIVSRKKIIDSKDYQINQNWFKLKDHYGTSPANEYPTTTSIANYEWMNRKIEANESFQLEVGFDISNGFMLDENKYLEVDISYISNNGIDICLKKRI